MTVSPTARQRGVQILMEIVRDLSLPLHPSLLRSFLALPEYRVQYGAQSTL